MAETNLAFSKIVSTPTPTAWSQAYSAGRVFASFSLESETIPQEGEEHLSSVGKDLISTFESEFFTLEAKNLESIKGALQSTIGRIKEGIRLSMVLCYLEDNVLYLFAIGGAKAVLKRGDKIGTVLQGEDERSEIKPASGYVQEGDILVLETKPFLNVIPSSTLASALESNDPAEIAESLAPHVHERAEGGASAVALMYKAGAPSADTPAPLTEEEEKRADKSLEEVEEPEEELQTEEEKIPVEEVGEEMETPAPEEPVLGKEITSENIEDELPTREEETPSPFVTPESLSRRRPSALAVFQRLPAVPRGRRTIAAIAVGLVLLIVVVSLLAINRNSSSQNQEAFAKVISEAQTKYDEGQNLKDLNASLAQESFKEARDILAQNQEKFKNNSDQNNQIQDLLAKVNSEIKGEGQKQSAKEVNKDSSDILSAEIDNSGGLFFSENENNVVFIDRAGVTQIDKGNGEKDAIFEKSWETPGGIGTFGSNIYVLDRENGVLKFVPSGNTYTESDYFVGDAPDLSDSSSMAIDGSVYVLFKDGGIQKFTRGSEVTFEVSGLSDKISNNAKLFTNADTDSLYVLDIGSGRVIVLSKTGEFENSYSADIVKRAKDFDVKEAEGRVYVLADNKVYQIDLE